MTPSRQLYLLRHAKSSWDDAALRDDQRPLAPRGRRAAALMQQHLRANDVSVGLVLCSPAQRTRDTWDGVRGGLSSDPEVRFAPAVYEATASALLDLVREIDQRQYSILIVGHNPGIEELAIDLIGDGVPKAVNRLRRGYPTGALAQLSVGVAWTDLDRGCAYLDSYVRPRDLLG